MNDPQMLDCFAGEGGAAMGYHQAGWIVYCVDNDAARLANNPFPSHCGDVLVVMATLNAGGAVDFTHPDGRVEWKRKADFKAIHGSPTCTGYSRGTTSIPDRFDKYDRFIPVARALFVESGLPYVIENVEDAGDELLEPALLCGRMFGLGAIDDDGTPLVLDRHRLFESNVPLFVPQHKKHTKVPLPGTPPCACGKTHFQVAGLYGGGTSRQVRSSTRPQGRVRATQPRSPARPQRHLLDHREGHLPRDPPRLHAVHRPPAAQPSRGDRMSGPIFTEAIGRWHVMRRDFEDYRERQHAAASHDCNGVLLNRTGMAAGVDTYSLFIGPRARAEKYASDELVEWWSIHGRMTVADFEAQTHDQTEVAA